MQLRFIRTPLPQDPAEGHEMTLDEQRSLAGRLDSHVLTLRNSCLDGMSLFNALCDRLPELKALKARKTAPLPFRLQRAAAILAHTDDPDAADAQSACREVAARIVSLEDALHAVLSGKEGGMEQARRAIATDWS